MAADIEVEEVDDVSVDHAVGDVAEDAGEDEGAGEAGELVGGFTEEQDEHDDGHDGAEDDVEIEPAAHESEGGAGVGHVDQIEESRDDGDFVVQGDVGEGRPLGQLVEDVKGDGEEEEEAERGH